MLNRIITNMPEPRDVFWQTFTECMSVNPRSARWLMALMALYLHLGPFSRYVVQQIEQKIEEIDRDGFDPRRATGQPAPALVSRGDASRPGSESLQPGLAAPMARPAARA